MLLLSFAGINCCSVFRIKINIYFQNFRSHILNIWRVYSKRHYYFDFTQSATVKEWLSDSNKVKIFLSFTINDADDGFDEDEYYGMSMWTTRLEPCFAACRPVCDLLRKVGKVPDQFVCAVLGVCRDLWETAHFDRLASVISISSCSRRPFYYTRSV